VARDGAADDGDAAEGACPVHDAEREQPPQRRSVVAMQATHDGTRVLDRARHNAEAGAAHRFSLDA